MLVRKMINMGDMDGKQALKLGMVLLTAIAIISTFAIVVNNFEASAFESKQVDFQVKQFDYGGPGLNVDYVEVEEQSSMGKPEKLNITANLSSVNRSTVLNGTDYDVRVYTKLGNIYNASIEVSESQKIDVYGLGLATANNTIIEGSSGLSGYKATVYPGRSRMALLEIRDSPESKNT